MSQILDETMDPKPCHLLTAEDFERHPTWMFDFSLEEIEEADETWVSPVALEFVPDETPDFFVRATLRQPDGSPLPGALLIRFEQYKPVVAGLVLFEDFTVLTITGNKISRDDEFLPAGILRTLPIEYECSLSTGPKTFTIRGMASF